MRASILAILLAACASEEPAPERPEIEEIEAPSPSAIEASGGFTAAMHADALRRQAGAPEEAQQMFERGCDRGYSPSCLALAEMIEGSDPDRANALIEQACHAGSTDACDRLGH